MPNLAAQNKLLRRTVHTRRAAHWATFMLLCAAVLTCGTSTARAQCSWQSVGASPAAGVVRAIAFGSGGSVFVAGTFNSIAGVPANNIARWDGTAWSALGDGVGGSVNALAVMPNGDVIAGGNFGSVGVPTTLHNMVARWDGTSWSQLANGLNSTVNTLLVRADGQLVAGGLFTAAAGTTTPVINRVARWNGTAWTGFSSGTSGAVNALAELPNGDLIATGSFGNAVTVPGEAATPAALRIIRWNNTTNAWVPMGTPTNGLSSSSGRALAVTGAGEVVVGGGFAMAGGVAATSRIARWTPGTGDAGVWSDIGGGGDTIAGSSVGVVTVLANGDIVASGGAVSGSLASRWNGTAWAPYATTSAIQVLTALAVAPNGDIYAAGYSTDTGGLNIGGEVARYSCLTPSDDLCCRGTTCNIVSSGTCTGTVAGSASVVVGSCGAGNVLATCCFADFNHDGSATIDDLFLYLNAYFTGSPWANVGGDGVEVPTIDDLFLYINAYFTGCV